MALDTTPTSSAMVSMNGRLIWRGADESELRRFTELAKTFEVEDLRQWVGVRSCALLPQMRL
jgi:hypothetical protein